MKNKLKLIGSVVLIASIVFGIVMFVRYQIKVKNTIIYLSKRELNVEKFLLETFPEEVSVYESKNTAALQQ